MVLCWLFLPSPTTGCQPGDYAIMNLLALCLPSPSPHPPSPSKTMISPLHNRTACTWEVKSGPSTHLWHSDRSSLRGFWKGRGVASNPLPNMLEEGFTWPSQLPVLKKNILLKSYSSCYLIYLSCTAKVLSLNWAFKKAEQNSQLLFKRMDNSGPASSALQQPYITFLALHAVAKNSTSW